MIKKIKLILHYGELDTTLVNTIVKYRFVARKNTMTMEEYEEIISSSLEELVKEVISHIPNIDKL